MIFEKIRVIMPDFTVSDDMYVVVTDNRISYVGNKPPREAVRTAHRRIDGSGRLLMSGFYNIHTHSPMTLLRGYGENLSLSDWLNKKIFPFEARMTPEDARAGALLACAEMIRGGVVSFTDMYYFGEMLFEACEEAGLKANISVPVTCFDGSDPDRLPSVAEMRRLSHRGDILLDYSIHAEYTSDRRTVELVAREAAERGVRLHIHLSETQAEHEECKVRHSMTPARYFESCGAFDVPVTAAHCVWLEPEDVEMFSRRGAFVAVNTVSNMKLASGFCDLPALIGAGVKFGLGTDGAASNNTLGMLHELRAFATVYKGAYRDPSLITPAMALEAATVSGARSQGRDGGTIETGKPADLIMLDVTSERYCPGYDLVTDIVYGAQDSDIVMTMVNGRVLYENGEFTSLDIERLKYEVKAAKERILCRM